MARKVGKMLNLPVDYLLQNKTVIAIVGPTAIGKTNLAIELALENPVEIISADSRQVYRYLDIGTSKPNKEEQQQVPHHFLNIRNPDEYYSAGEFGAQADKKINEIFSKRNLPIIVGGSGLYIKSLCEGFFEENFTPEEKLQLQQVRRELSFYSREALFNKLLEVDPESAKLYPDKNCVRLIRALEFYIVKGIPISTYRKLYHRKPSFKTIYIGLITQRDVLYENIEHRVDLMIQRGLVAEVRKILDIGYSPNLNSLNSVGYKEIIEYFEGKISLDVAIATIKQNTKHYAKRQITWFKKISAINWFDIYDIDFKAKVLNFLNKFAIRS